MQQEIKEKKQIAVIVGRFQVPYLTLGHKWLLQTAFVDYDKVVVLIGDTKILPGGYKRMDSHDPFPYDLRANMVSEFTKECISPSQPDELLGIYRFEDVGNLPIWNKKLDDFLDTINPDPDNYEFVMVGSRDSFATRYSGKNKVNVLPIPEDSCLSHVSGTAIREKTFEQLSETLSLKGKEFREGVLWAIMEMERLQSLNNDGKEV